MAHLPTRGFMKIIGLTGGIATGKSAVAEILKKKGIPVVDADELSHAAIKYNTDGYKQVVEQFGADIVGEHNEIIREKLGKIVFSNPKKLKILESIVHPIVAQKMQIKMKELSDSGHDFAVYMLPLLFENNLENNFKDIILVDIPVEIQIKRLMARSGFSKAECCLRIGAQMSREEKIKKTRFIVDNSSTLEETENRLNDALKIILN